MNRRLIIGALMGVVAFLILWLTQPKAETPLPAAPPGTPPSAQQSRPDASSSAPFSSDSLHPAGVSPSRGAG